MAKPKAHLEPPAPPRRSPWPLRRVWAVALVTFRQAIRAKLWILIPPAIAILVLADLASQHYDPVYETIPATISLSLLVMAVLALVLALFFATYALPMELESKIAHTVMTKPLNRAEAVAGKALGMSLVVLAAVGLVGLGAYIHIQIRSTGVQAIARTRLAEARPRAAFPADLTALEAIAEGGPLQTYRYVAGTEGPPAMGVDVGHASASPAGARWILGETGVQLQWPLGQTPLTEWVAGARGRIHLSLGVVQPADRPSAPTQVVVALLPQGVPLTRETAQAGPDTPIYQATFEVPPSGELDIPVSGARMRPAPGVLNCAPEGDLALSVAVLSGGHALGGGPRSARIIGPAGQEFVVAGPPHVMQTAGSVRRVSLAGSDQAPRQTATFQLADVPAGALGDGDATIEAAFGLDAWAPATVLPVAVATFIRADGQEQTVSFTPDSHHSTLLRIDKSFWHGGPLAVRLQCLTDDDYLNLLPESIRLRQDGGPFILNFTKAILRVWLFGSVLAALGVALSTRLSWFVGILAAAVALLVVTVGKSLVMTTLAVLFTPTPRIMMLRQWMAWVPDPRSLLPDTALALGQAMSGAEFLWVAATAAAVVLVLLGIGTLLLRGREVAA